MGRKSLHKPEELKALFIQATLDIIEDRGVAGLSARSVAKRVGYSPGTIYNVFENLDALIFHVEVRILDDLCERLMEAQTGVPAAERLARVAHAYLEFAEQRPHAWALLVEHVVGSRALVPAAYVERLDLVVKIMGNALKSTSTDQNIDQDPDAARTLFCLLNGTALLSTSPKLAELGASAGHRLIDAYLETIAVARGAELRHADPGRGEDSATAQA